MKNLLLLIGTLGFLSFGAGWWAMLLGIVFPGATLILSGAILIGAVAIGLAILADREIRRAS